jgi:hypothetical protein
MDNSMRLDRFVKGIALRWRLVCNVVPLLVAALTLLPVTHEQQPSPRLPPSRSKVVIRIPPHSLPLSESRKAVRMA